MTRRGNPAPARERARQAKPAPEPQRLRARELRTRLRAQLGDGDRLVLWEEDGDQALVHARAAEVKIREPGLIVTVPIETVETGLSHVSLAMALAHGDQEPDLIVALEEQPRGHPLLVARWGGALEEAVLGALLDILDEAAEAAGAKPLGFRVRGATLELALRRRSR